MADSQQLPDRPYLPSTIAQWSAEAKQLLKSPGVDPTVAFSTAAITSVRSGSKITHAQFLALRILFFESHPDDPITDLPQLESLGLACPGDVALPQAALANHPAAQQFLSFYQKHDLRADYARVPQRELWDLLAGYATCVELEALIHLRSMPTDTPRRTLISNTNDKVAAEKQAMVRLKSVKRVADQRETQFPPQQQQMAQTNYPPMRAAWRMACNS